MLTHTFAIADAHRLPLEDSSIDLIVGSPPYEAQRTYSIGFNLRGQAWVDWMVAGFREWLRVSRGPVVMVMEGFTKNFRYSATPFLLMADLHRAGITLRKPPVFHRVGTPGSGGPDWLRNDYELIVCATRGGKLPWSHNVAMGHPPKFAPGGEMSNRLQSGERRDKWGGTPHASSGAGRRANGGFKSRGRIATMIATSGAEPKVAAALARGMKPGAKLHTKNNGSRMRVQCYEPPPVANPGNILHCKVGGGLMGSQLAHENEAPFPEYIPEFFIRSFCPPGGIVCDPFSGSGTTVCVAAKHGRSGIGFDIRESQIELGRRRLTETLGTIK